MQVDRYGMRLISNRAVVDVACTRTSLSTPVLITRNGFFKAVVKPYLQLQHILERSTELARPRRKPDTLVSKPDRSYSVKNASARVLHKGIAAAVWPLGKVELDETQF